MEQNYQQTEKSFLGKHNTLIKGLFIGFLVLVMLIPTAFLMSLISEREKRQNEVTQEISNKWATEQTIAGPLLSIPYFTSTIDKDGKVITQKKRLVVLPDQLNINGKVIPDTRHRSLYTVTVYRSEMVIKGKYNAATLSALNTKSQSILWNEAQFQIGIDDSRGLEDNPAIQYNNKKATLDIGGATEYFKETLASDVHISDSGDISFKLVLKLKGTGKLYFTPTGNTTTVNITSNKGIPSFDGYYMPDNIQEKTDSGFSATWKILKSTRGYNQVWHNDNTPDISKSAFGVKLIQQADHYDKTFRSVKYAILVIGLTFLIFFFIEIAKGRRIHPLQYILVGFALIIFYSLLLSISEYTGFNMAYVIAALATVSLISWYIYGIFKKVGVTVVFCLTLSALYAYIFFLIQLKDYALLFGSIGLFCILAGIMYYSRNFNWYQIKNTENES